VKREYRPEKMVFFVLGDVAFENVKKVVGKRLQTIQPIHPTEPVRPVSSIKRNAGIFIEERGTHQAHVMIGRAAYGSKDDKRIALYFLNNILGGPGMNSRLNIALREHKGLVYTVESSLTNYTDTSTWAVYFGCDEEDVERCLKIVRGELNKLMLDPLTDRQFQAALKQIKGQIGVACDNFENYALDMAKAYLHYNKVEGMRDTIEHLEKLTPQLLQEVAQEMFDEQGLTTLIFR
jgi:predicted Zn-dependent peptidase